jgi:16S rRNA (cytosine967-C5)-methyltransferase
MSSATAARPAALEVLRAVRRGDLADRALVPALNQLPVRERPLTQELVYGVLRLRGRLDHALAQHSSRPLVRVEPDVLDALRLGAYQLLELAGVPAYAAVSESVELVKRTSPRAAGFANAVLQSLQRGRMSLTFPPLTGDPRAHLVSWGSHPEWLVDRWLERYGPGETAALVEANNTRPQLYLRLLTPDSCERLRAADIAAEPHPWVRDVVRLTDGTALGEALAAAPAVVQDPAAALVVQYADPPAGSLVADLCAAPGGKALGLAAGAGYVVAADLSPGRLRRMRENLERVRGLGAGADVGLVVADGRAPAVRAGDVVFLDAPCTGTGTLRRHPDGRWRLQPRDLAALVVLQRELLAAAHALLQPGGLLVYATCSLEPEENEAQVMWFLANHPEYESASTRAVPGEVLDGDWLRVLPQRHGVDGAFAARLVRRAHAG